MLVNMKEILEIAEKEQYAIPCINTPNVKPSVQSLVRQKN